jgi:hypothetical protein
MPAILTVQFTPAELNWLQANVQQFNEEKWAQMGNDDENHAIGGGQEHGWFADFLAKVRVCIMNPHQSVTFTDVNQLNFIKKWFTDYKNSSAGEYIFTGVAGDNVRIGQFPSFQGSANSNIEGQGGFPEEQFLTGSNIFNGILQKLGDVIYPPISPVYHSPGEV